VGGGEDAIRGWGSLGTDYKPIEELLLEIMHLSVIVDVVDLFLQET
jgi:hypothetical protein